MLPGALNTGASSFAPVAGYIFWYSPTNSMTNNSGVSPPSTGDQIKAWGDLSANAYHLQSLASSQQPIYRIGNSSVTKPPANNPYLQWLNQVQWLTNKFATVYSQPSTFFFVINGNARSGAAAVLNGAADQNNQVLFAAPPGAPQMYAGSIMAGPSGFSSDIWFVLTCQFNGASSILRSNGVQLTLTGTTVGTGTLKGLTIGNYFNGAGGTSMGGGLGDVVGYNSALSSGDMLKEEEFLANEYGITGVP